LHVVWWVLDASAGRYDSELMHKLATPFLRESMPIFIVLNKSDIAKVNADRLRADVERTCKWAAKVLCIVASPENGPMMHVCSKCGADGISINTKDRRSWCGACGEQPFKASYGIKELVDATKARLPSLVVASFISAQGAWLRDLDYGANWVITTFTGLAAVGGAVPSPVSRFLLVPVQAAGVAAVGQVYDVSISFHTAREIVCSMLTHFVGSVADLAVPNWFESFPQLGLCAMVAEAATAGTVTALLLLTARHVLRTVRSSAMYDGRTLTPELLVDIMSREEARRYVESLARRIANLLGELMRGVEKVTVEFLQRHLPALFARASDDAGIEAVEAGSFPLALENATA